MEREVSPDSSTHIPEKGSSKAKKRKHKHRSSKSKYKSSKSSSVSEGDSTSHHKKHHKKKKHSVGHEESDEDIIDIRPLAEYVEDKKELHKQIFSIVPKKEIKNMLPDLLKKMEYKELKKLCLEQLEVMSQKRLRHIIAGEEMMSSSSDESGVPTNQETEQNDNENTDVAVSAVSVKKPKEPDNINILQEMSISPNQDEIDELVEGRQNNITAEGDDITIDQEQEPNEESTTKGKTGEEGEEEEEEEDDGALVVAEAELKELEFRARALKSLVRARETHQKVKPGTEQMQTKDT